MLMHPLREARYTEMPNRPSASDVTPAMLFGQILEVRVAYLLTFSRPKWLDVVSITQDSAGCGSPIISGVHSKSLVSM